VLACARAFMHVCNTQMLLFLFPLTKNPYIVAVIVAVDRDLGKWCQLSIALLHIYTWCAKKILTYEG